MADKKFSPVNEVIVRGIVTDIRNDRNRNRVMVISVKDRQNNIMHLDFVCEPGVGRGITIKSRVVVEGYIKAFSFYNDALRKQSSVRQLVAVHINRDKTELEARFGVKGGHFFPETLFRAFIVGTVVKTSMNEKTGWGSLTVETCGGGNDMRPCKPELQYYTKTGYLPVFDFIEGDKVAIKVRARQREISRGGDESRAYTFLDLGVGDIAVLERAPRENDMFSEIDPMTLGLAGDPIEPEPMPMDDSSLEN